MRRERKCRGGFMELWGLTRARALDSPRCLRDSKQQIAVKLMRPSCCRLKMGISEGSPRAILPDKLGRADYHGASMKQAERLMDAGEGAGGHVG